MRALRYAVAASAQQLQDPAVYWGAYSRNNNSSLASNPYSGGVKMYRSLGLILALLAAAAPMSASSPQVTARQGTAPPPEEAHFASPMVLDLQLPRVTAVEPGSLLRLADVRKYICDNHVTLLNLTVAKQYKGPRKARSLELVVAGSVSVADSYDRRVDIALQLRSGEEKIAAQTLRNYSTEEERVTPFRILLPVDESKLEAAYSSENAPVLELTLTVRDDS